MHERGSTKREFFAAGRFIWGGWGRRARGATFIELFCRLARFRPAPSIYPRSRLARGADDRCTQLIGPRREMSVLVRGGGLF